MTLIELLKKSLLKIGVVDITQAPDAEQGVEALSSLNMMLALWREDGIDLGWYPQTDMDAVVPLKEAYQMAVISNLAIFMAPDYGAQTSAELQAIASSTYDAMAKAARLTFQADMTMLPGAEGDGYWPLNVSQP